MIMNSVSPVTAAIAMIRARLSGSSAVLAPDRISFSSSLVAMTTRVMSISSAYKSKCFHYHKQMCIYCSYPTFSTRPKLFFLKT